MKSRQNTLLTLIRFCGWFFRVALQSFSLFFRALTGKPIQPLRENSFLDVVNFVFHTGPRGFWKKPSGLRIGRSVATFLHYFFFKNETFRKK